MGANRVVVIGAGIGGLAAALELASHGVDVTVVERHAAPGGKAREVEVDGVRLDAGPTVLTMRWIFEEIFAAAGASLADHLTLRPADVLARHAWSADHRLDLFADVERSADAIAAFAGPAEGRRYVRFCARARRTYDTLEHGFIRSPAPTPVALVRGAGLGGLGDLLRISPFETLWRALEDEFHDPRLRQLFARYATYVGSSPFLAPATLMLIAHVEREGVWLVDGGIHRVPEALAALAAARGATLRYGADAREVVVSGARATGVTLASGERIEADAVVVNADVAAVAAGRLGPGIAHAAPATPRDARSLSALTWALNAETDGFPLARHTVFFSGDYAAEFDDLFGRARLPEAPTVYVCAQDRGDDSAAPRGPERLFCLVNAPAIGDTTTFEAAEIERCAERSFGLLARCGLHVRRRAEATTVTTPTDFERLFPATGGALYGRASHGWRASFSRPPAATRVPGLYLAGGSAHPGAGLPMAALSGRMAAARILADFASTGRSRKAATRGGTSTR